MPLVNNQSTNFGSNLGNALKDTAVGAGKSFVRGTRDVAGMIQGLGKGLLNKFGADTSNMGIQSVDNSTPIGSQVNTMLQPTSQAQKIGGYLETTAELGAGLAGGNAEALINKGKGLVTSAKNTMSGINAVSGLAKDTAQVTDTLAPKLTMTERKLAQSQGRIVPGQKATFFKGGTADTVLPSQSTKEATQVVMNRIPNASQMAPSDLYKAVNNEIDTTAKALRPAMEQTTIKPETIQKINDEWSALKKTQLETAPATEEANVAKRQQRFEQILQKSGNEHQGHLWDTRIEYDKSIPKAVKTANHMSSESLQLQKQEWLQNRAILNNAINDTVHGMGQKSQQAFNEMTKLYEAKNNLLGKTALAKPEASGASKLYNSKGGKTVRTIAKYGLGGEIIKHELGL